jgi:hypothetical protein
MPRAFARTVALSFICFQSLVASSLSAQVAPAGGDALRVFLDCQRCDEEYLRTEIGYVDYVRDRTDANIHVLVTTLQTGAGGTEYSFQFVGQQQFQGVTEDLRFASGPTDSEDQVREGIARALGAGLVRYAARTALLDRLKVSVTGATGDAASSATPARDPWNNWVFRAGLSGFTDGEASYQQLNWNASLSANRTTAGWKNVLQVNIRASQSDTDLGDGRTVTNTQNDRNASSLVVRSLNNHWSVGTRLRANTSTFLNRDLAFRAAPAVEYNLFPYSESTRRQFTLLYSAGANRVAYDLETIYGKLEETLWDEALTASLNVTQRWGTVRVEGEGQHYFHDPSKYHLTAFSELDLRVYKGVSINFFGQAERIHDQLHLAAGDLTPEEILLRQRQISTAYRYFGQIGLSYSFGSIYSSVVNPRMRGDF